MALRSILFMVIGAIYLINPHLISRWILKKTNASSDGTTTRKYVLMMRILGGILVAAGIILALV